MVKGTQFRVTVNAGKTTVDVIRGQVEVSDFKSGQIAQVMAGQHATAFANGKPGLSLGGAGTLSPIEHGKPRAPSIERVPVPRNGLAAPRHAASGQNTPANALPPKHGVTRISASIGEVRVNFHRVTNGLAHGGSPGTGASRGSSEARTVWNSSSRGPETAAANNGLGENSNGNGAAASAAGRANASAAAAAAGGNANSGNGNGHSGTGNSGNGNGNGNGNEVGGGNGANGNGRGNHGHGRNR